MDYRDLLDEQVPGFVSKFKIPIALSLVGLVLIIGGSVVSNKPQTKSFPKESLVETQKSIQVDVSGAVNNPGVYPLMEGSRIEEAIKLAGGIAKDANTEYISKNLNLAQKLSDGSKIYIPFEGETVSSSQVGAVAGVNASNQSGQININTASQGELESLPGIGPVTASKIVSGRPYQSLDELVSKKVTGKAVYEKIKDLVSY